jgi:EAL domain-containing protein (putative c-di-GMP-specific phosphodiesterase class I)
LGDYSWGADAAGFSDSILANVNSLKHLHELGMLEAKVMMKLADHDPTRAQIRHSRVASRLDLALRQKGLELAYQPEFDLQTQQIVSFEALCRWHDEELGTVAPDEFIAVAEASGLVVPLGEYILDRVLSDLPSVLHRWPQARVAVNVSGVELARPDFAIRMATTLRNVDPALAGHLELEVTESVFHHDLPTVTHNLQSLRQLQITVAIDDFGTGQSSLARLHTLPFDKIKLDRSFVQALDNPMPQAIVRAMTQLAAAFSRTLVVEGIETAAQLKQLIELGCRMGQGYILCRPVALADLPDNLSWPS